MRTYVYIDGFNLYYGALKTRWPQFKWLNLMSFAADLLPNDQVIQVRYFTALVIAPPNDPGTRTRQETYLRALGTLPKVSVTKGWFVEKDGLRYQSPLAYPNHRQPGKHPPQAVHVRLPKEKGSDVNLAAHMLLDAHNNLFEQAIVISNDSDLTEPVRMIAQEFGKTVGVINPHPRSHRSGVLSKVATWTFQEINKKYFANNQLPTTLTDAAGQTIHKPPTW